MTESSSPPALGREALRRLLADRPQGDILEMARKIAAGRPAKPAAAATGRSATIERLPRGGPLPATFYQQWAWRGLRGVASAELNMPYATRCTGPLSVPCLEASFRALERRHEGLRTRMVAGPDDPTTVWQVVDPPGRLEIPCIDLTALPSSAREGELRRIADEDAALPMDIAHRTMFRVRLVRLAEADHGILFNLHHLVGDAWSVEVLRRELLALYLAAATGNPSPFPELPVQLGDFAGWQKKHEGGERMASQLDYWRRRLADAPPPLALRGDYPFRKELRTDSVQARFHLGLEAAASLRRLASAHGATPPMAILTAFQLLLAAYSGQTDILVGSKVVGRPLSELTHVIGLFMNTVIHRVDLSGAPSFGEALDRVRAVVLEDYRHQDLPFPRLMQELFPEHALSRLVPSRVAFNMIADPGAGGELPPGAPLQFSSRGLKPAEEQAKFDLLITGEPQGEEIEVIVIGAASRFRQETVADIAGDLEAVLARAPESPSAPLAELLPRPRFLDR
jgi:hypothetical protein